MIVDVTNNITLKATYKMKENKEDYHTEKTELFAKYETGKYTGADLAEHYNISSVCR